MWKKISCLIFSLKITTFRILLNNYRNKTRTRQYIDVTIIIICLLNKKTLWKLNDRVLYHSCDMEDKSLFEETEQLLLHQYVANSFVPFRYWNVSQQTEFFTKNLLSHSLKDKEYNIALFYRYFCSGCTLFKFRTKFIHNRG